MSRWRYLLGTALAFQAGWIAKSGIDGWGGAAVMLLALIASALYTEKP